ncbi:hypothetical protein [Demequina sp. SO4-18]|uniref:hypothetical protein n=1 Tax=Demequina sp. SO4-18 TaxID=3401026 RepID=UPI003B5C601A
MSDARQAFYDLHSLAERGFDASEIAKGPDQVERRVARWRGARAAVTSVASIAVVALVAVGVNQARSAEPMPAHPVGPPVTASAAPGPEPTGESANPAGCAEAVVVPGKPVGNLGGLMGSFEDTTTAPCSEWDQENPDTVLIYTADNTMVEAYYRTSIDALGPYADLGPDFKVPDPDPNWPENSLVLIDVRTGEVLLSTDVPETFGTSEEGATVLSDRLLSDAVALADRLEELASMSDAPDGLQISPEAIDTGNDGDLADPLVFVPAQDPLSGDLPTIVARLVPGDETAARSSEAEVLETQLPVGGAVLFEVADPQDMESRTMQLGVPIGGDATLVVVGNGYWADRYLIELVAWHILAE